MEEGNFYATDQQADALYPKAQCILLRTRGRYYYAEEFNEWIEIDEWEQEQILRDPYLYYFSVALRKHEQWKMARADRETLSFLEVLNAHKGSDAAPFELPAFPPNALKKPNLIDLLNRLEEMVHRLVLRAVIWARALVLDPDPPA